MDERRVVRDLRVNVLRADQVAVWHGLLELALELQKPQSVFRSIRPGSFAYIGADGRTGSFSPAILARILDVPAPLMASTIDVLLELQLMRRDGDALCIEDAADYFTPATEHPRLRN